MLDDLPSDLLLAIVRNLSLSDVANLRRVSKAWNSFMDQNQFTVFHTAAVLNFQLPPSAELQDLKHLYSPRALNGVSTWKDLCKRHFEINKSWRGITPSTITSHQYTGNSHVHRFKVDERAALIIATSSFGGLTVTDLNASKWYDGRLRNMSRNPDAVRASAVLWELPKNCVRPYAHCEYGHGYLIFDRLGGSKEVWRLADYDYYYPSSPSSSDETPPPPLTVAPEVAPDFMQKRAGERASVRRIIEELPDREEEEESPPLRRGHFVPWVLLRPDDHTRAFRFVYPILLVASFTTAYLYDVRTGSLAQEIQNLQLGQLLEDDDDEFTEPSLGELSYVEHCSRYVFICGETCLRVFSRQSGQWIYDIPSIKYSYGWSRWKLSSQRDDRMGSLNCIRSRTDNDLHAAWNEAGSIFYRHELVRETVMHRPIDNPIVAAHVSSCGNYLAVLLKTSRVLIIRDLERLFKGELSLLDCTIEVQLGRDARVSRYHAFENGRVAVANRNGIFVVIPDPSFFNSEPLSASSPPPTVLRVHPLNDSPTLDSVTCLQMTQTGLFVNWARQCPVTVHSPEYSDDDRKEIYAGHEGSFWSQLAQPLTFGLDLEGNMFVEEDEESRMTSDSVVLSVDFVQT
ncbi:hypothetical protein APHAL10511_006634 [Amanita phalloides]|nr:hypothetical protein APHAL10511_006634 [Amanita phalloides]